MQIITTIQLFSKRFMLTIFVKPNLSFEAGHGFLTLTDKTETFISDNLSYFFDIDLEKKEELKGLLKDNGFDTPKQFFAFFNENFIGKLIHWTDLKY